MLPPNAFPRINQGYITLLNKLISNEEIKSTLFDMAPLKAPRSDGYYVVFYQS